MQKKLSQWAAEDPGEAAGTSTACSATHWLRVAHLHVNANQGRETAGVDGATMARFNGDVGAILPASASRSKPKPLNPCLSTGVHPQSQREEEALRHSHHDDRIVQEALRMLLELLWEADFSNRSYGFRPNRSTYDAIAYIGNRLAGPGGPVTKG